MVPWLLCALLGGWGLYLLGRLYCLHRTMEALAGQLTDWLDRDATPCSPYPCPGTPMSGG
ncbi:MAG: hypothetical protein ACLSTT_03950 [Evtepia gabavorous]